METKHDRKNVNTDTNTYGGFRYRASYDGAKREEELRRVRAGRRGNYLFAATCAAVTVFCFTAVSSVLIWNTYGGQDASVSAGAHGGEIAPDNPAVEFRDCGGFIIENMEERISDVYHIPRGVRVSYVATLQQFPQNAGVLANGDVIVSVNGTDTPNVDSFDIHVTNTTGTGNSVVDMVIYREGKYIDVRYVLD